MALNAQLDSVISATQRLGVFRIWNNRNHTRCHSHIVFTRDKSANASHMSSHGLWAFMIRDKYAQNAGRVKRILNECTIKYMLQTDDYVMEFVNWLVQSVVIQSRFMQIYNSEFVTAVCLRRNYNYIEFPYVISRISFQTLSTERNI